MSAVSGPDIEGFLEAQNRLRERMGRDVDFMIRTAPVWPPDTPLDDAGSPYDPTVKPASGGDLRPVTKRVGVITKQASPLRPGAVTHFEPIGPESGIDLILDLNAADYDDVQTAVQVWLNTLRFAIVEWVPGGLGRLDRYLVYGQEL